MIYFKEEKTEVYQGMRITYSEMYVTGFNLRDALRRQAEQLDMLAGKPYEKEVREAIASATNVEGCDLDAEISVKEINQRVPRGGAIESLVFKARQK